MTNLLSNKSYNRIKHQSCIAHTLQLSVLEGLKQCKPFHHRIKSLQAFFRTPKQGQRLCAMQQKNSQQGHQLSENEHTNPLDVLTDVKTRWSSTYYAWKKILELYNYMRLIYIDLLSKPNRASKKEGEKLERLCLSLEEREFLQQMIGLLEPIKCITCKICGATYPTITLINPYIDLLKNFFAPREEAEKTFDTYLDLIYGSESANNNGNETNSDSDYELLSGRSRQ